MSSFGWGGTNAHVVLAELPAEEAAELCRPYGDRLVVASVNAPATVVLAGDAAAVAELVESLASSGVGCWPLRAKLPFHSPLMEEASRKLETALAGLKPEPRHCPILSTVTGKVEPGTAFDAAYWRRNVRQPVRFQTAVEVAADLGCRAFLEVSTQPLLATAVSQCLEGRGDPPPAVLISMRPGREHATLLESLGGLWTCGIEPDWPRLCPSGGRLVTLPTYPFQRRSYWLPDAARSTEAPRPAVPRAAEPADEVEQVLANQLQAFNRLVAQQLTILGTESAEE